MNKATTAFLSLMISAQVSSCGRELDVLDPIPIESVSVNSDLLSGKDENGDEVFGFRFDGSIRRSWLADLDQTGADEVIAVVESGGGTLQAVGRDSSVLRSAGLLKRPSIYPDELLGDRAEVSSICFDDFLPGVPGLEIAIAVNENSAFSPGRLVLLSGQTGAELGSYWHPGKIEQLLVVDLGGKGVRSLVGVGLNEDLKYAQIRRDTVRLLSKMSSGNYQVVFRIDPADIRGQAPPFLSIDNT